MSSRHESVYIYIAFHIHFSRNCGTPILRCHSSERIFITRKKWSLVSFIAEYGTWARYVIRYDG